MAPKLKKQPSTSASGTSTDTPVKPSRVAWKTGEQLEYLLSQWQVFVAHQNSGTLDRFWPHIYDTWYQKWPITAPTPMAINQAGSPAAAILFLRGENNQRIRTWFHNRARPNSRASRSDLRLNQNEKRKLAPTQAYCTYAWDSGLKETVIARWEEQKRSRMVADDDDPSPESTETSESASHVPIDFKLKVAKEVYDSLSPKSKKKVDDRREKDRKEQYRPILEITDIEERDKKLALHKQNQPSVTRSLTRVLKNLEDQAGCVAHLLIGYIDPTDGSSTIQNFSQGKTDLGLEFAAFCGRDWEEVVERRFQEWALRIFGEMGSSRRSTFMLNDTPLDGREVASSSTEGTSQTSGVSAVGDFSKTQPRTDTTTADEVFGAFGVIPPSQPLEISQAVPSQTTIPPLIYDHPAAAEFLSPGSNFESSVSPQASTTVGFAAPRQIFPPPVFVESVKSGVSVASSTVAEPPPATPSQALEHSKPVASHQAVVSPVIPEVPYLVASSPTLVSSQTIIPGEVNVRPMVPEPLLVTPSPVLEFPQMVTPTQLLISPTIPQAPLVPPSIAIPPTVLEPLQAINPQGLTDQPQVSEPPQVIGGHQTVASAYKRQGQTNATATMRSRRDSIEGAPDIMLTLNGSGYALVNPSAQADISTAPPSTTHSSPTLSDGELVPSSECSLEEFLTIPAEVGGGTSSAPRTDELTIPSSPQSLEKAHTVSGEANTTSSHFSFAPRVIPDYNIDRSDFPSWLIERSRLDYVLFVEAGDIWEKLITTWLRQERRLGFGLNDKIGATLSMRKKPEVLKDYFKWHHNPTKGDSVLLPEFGDEVSVWWTSLQPKWRYKGERHPESLNDYSYVLAGGKKGVFLLILCLAWWDRAYGRDMEREKVKRREAARAAGKDDATLDFSDLSEHESKWFNIVNDLIIVLELAQGWPIPGEGTPGEVGAVPARRKRPAEGAGVASRKKTKSS